MTSGVGFCTTSATATTATKGTTYMYGAATGLAAALTSPVSGISNAATWVNNKKFTLNRNCALPKFNSFY
jgi:hypothetical protein